MKERFTAMRWVYDVMRPCPGAAFENPNGGIFIGEYGTLEEAVKACGGAYICKAGFKCQVEEYDVVKDILDEDGDVIDSEVVYQETVSQNECDEFMRRKR